MYFEQISTPGLGCFSYAIGSSQAGVMAVVDPRRDIETYLRIAKEQGLRITHIFDTHVHADHISGTHELRAATGADLYIHENAPVGYEAKKIQNGDEFRLGDVVLRVLHTPGHTPNSVSLLVTDLARAATPALLLTGDLLFIGDVGRPDLPGAEIMTEQVENLYRSLYQTLAALPDELEVYPAHGQGSLCGQGMSAKPSSTLGLERKTNPMLNCADFQAFKSAVLARLPMRPQSFSEIIATNLDGPAVLAGKPSPEYARSPEAVDEALRAGALPLDLRSTASFSKAHLKGSISVDANNPSMLNWIGVVVPPGLPLVLVLPANRGFEAILTELRRIGYDQIKGWLDDDLQAWQQSGRATESLPQLTAAELKQRLAGANPPTVIDVRNPEEFNARRIAGALNLPLNRLAVERTCPVAPDQEIVVMCQSGFRSVIGASILQSMGYSKISNLTGGILSWKD